MATRQEIKRLNDRLRERYAGASNIRHYVGDRSDETHLTTDAMPNTDRAGRIFAGYTDDLLRDLANGSL